MKGQNFRKVLTMLLLLTTMFVIAGCSKKEKDVNGGNGSTEPNQTEGTNTPETPETTKTLADYEKETSFKYFNMAAGVETEALNNSATAQLVKEQTGYDVYYDQAPADPTDAQTAITNIFMLKSDYQSVKVTKAQFYTLLEMDALMPITEYVDASTNLKEVISEFGWETAKKDGEIYGIPQKSARLASSTGIAYRVDWLNEYNTANPDAMIPVPSEENNYSMTLSDFKTMLTYFATKVPEGGKAMAIDTSGVYLENILPAFGIYNEWADVNGELQYVINQPGFENYMAYMKDLFDSGLVQYQATANDNGAVKSLQAKTVGAGRIAHWNAVTIESTETSATDENISYIVSLIPDENKGDASAVRVFAAEGYAYYVVVPKYATAKQAAAVVDYADKKLEKDFFLKMVLGTEGETYKVENGEYYPILPAFDEQQSLADKFMEGTREEDYAKYWLCRTRKTEAQDKMFSTSNFNIDKTGIQNPIAVMPPNTVFDTFYSAANVEVRDALVKTLYQTGVNTSLEEIQAKFNSFDGEKITTAVNEWYKGWELKDSFNAVKPR
jgi:putative aldouronate transport system substrate-binding protein